MHTPPALPALASGLLLLLPGLLGAQTGGSEETGGKSETEGGRNPNPAARASKRGYRLGSKGVVEITCHADGTQTERVVPAAEVRRLRAKGLIPRIHCDKLFVARASIRPRRLAPGERGVLHVLVQLAEEAVVLPDARISLEILPGKLPVDLGRTAVVPPTDGTLPTVFAGKRVYDQVVEIRTPIRVRPDAAHGDYPIAGYVELDLHDANTGKLMGTFYCGIDGRMKVGRPLPRPPPPAPVTPQPDTGRTAGASRPATRTRTEDAHGARRQDPGDPPAPGDRTHRRPDGEDGEAGGSGSGSAPVRTAGSLLLLGCGAAALLALVAILLVRRR